MSSAQGRERPSRRFLLHTLAAIAGGRRPREGRLVAKKLADHRLGLYASRRYLDAHGTPANLADLVTHRRGFAVHRVAGLHTAEFLKEWRSSVAVSLKMGQIEAVRAGAGIGILHAIDRLPVRG